MVNIAKKTQVDELSTQLADTPHFALIKYEKTPHKTLETIRRALGESGSRLQMIKNSALQRALNRVANTNKALREVRKSSFPLTENSALLSLGEDYVTGLSAFYRFTKDNEGLSFKWGFVDGSFYDMARLTELAKLPPKEELQARLIGLLKTPAARLVGSLNFNMNKLVFVLTQRSTQSN
jgi:large subunit ribosomal protein L10